MQPFPCDLQPQNIKLRTQKQPLVTKHRKGTTTPPTAPVPFSAGHSQFTRKNTRFRAPASSPKQNPCNIHAAIAMRFAASRRKPARIYAHSNRAWQQSYNHSTAICNHSFKKRKELCTQEQRFVTKHREGTTTTPPAPAEKHKVSCSYLSIYLPTYLSYLHIYLPIYLSIYLSYLPTYLSTYLPIYLPILPIYSIYLSTYLPI